MSLIQQELLLAGFKKKASYWCLEKETFYCIISCEPRVLCRSNGKFKTKRPLSNLPLLHRCTYVQVILTKAVAELYFPSPRQNLFCPIYSEKMCFFLIRFPFQALKFLKTAEFMPFVVFIAAPELNTLRAMHKAVVDAGLTTKVLTVGPRFISPVTRWGKLHGCLVLVPLTRCRRTI